MTKKPTVTVGIPAYNEEMNIGHLLRALFSQERKSYKLQSIIVACDACDDKTVEKIRSLKNNKVKLLEGKHRKGQSYRQDQIIKGCNSDILVLLNADIELDGPSFVEKLIAPIFSNNADLVSSNVLPLKPWSFFERVLYVGYHFKNYQFEKLNGGINVYTCHGAARAFSKKYFKRFSFKGIVAEDAYSYFTCVSRGLKYAYAKNAVAFIRLPGNMKDHSRQSFRFTHARTKFLNSFDKELLSRSYNLSKKKAIKGLLISLVRNPVEMSMYLILLVYMRLLPYVIPHEHTTVWQVAASSKNLSQAI